MAENLVIPASATREELYQSVLPQIEAVIAGESNMIANLANISAVLHEAFHFFWVGFYLVDSPQQLVLGPFQGPLACTRIQIGKGVCGASWQQNKTIIVPDVELFPGHIACSSLSRSEIVVPIRNKAGEVTMVLDVDSELVDHFSTVDQVYLEKLAVMISNTLN